jgi:hypothetical protein
VDRMTALLLSGRSNMPAQVAVAVAMVALHLALRSSLCPCVCLAQVSQISRISSHMPTSLT